MRTQQQPMKSGKRYREGILASCLAFLATVAAVPGHAINIPSLPLQSGSAYPPANVRFILDDSGSMNLIAMPAALADPIMRAEVATLARKSFFMLFPQ